MILRLRLIMNQTKFINNKIHEDIKLSYNLKLDEFCELSQISKETVFSNPKIEFRYFCFRHLDIISKISIQDIKKELFYEAVLIEFRKLHHLEFLIRNCILKLGTNWSYTIVCGIENVDFIKAICSKISPNINIFMES